MNLSPLYCTFVPIKQRGGIKFVQTETGDAVVPATHNICTTWASLFFLHKTEAVAADSRPVGSFPLLQLRRHQHSSVLFPPISPLPNYLCRLVKLRCWWRRAKPGGHLGHLAADERRSAAFKRLFEAEEWINSISRLSVLAGISLFYLMWRVHHPLVEGVGWVNVPGEGQKGGRGRVRWRDGWKEGWKDSVTEK